MPKKKQIVAIGGGAFNDKPDRLAIERYILSLTTKKKPRVCYLPTASGDAEINVQRFYVVFERLGAAASHVSLFRQERALPASTLLQNQDVIFVGGGNTRNLLVLWNEWDIVDTIRRSYVQGTILAGSSAGALCWFEEGLTDSNPGGYSALTCLGWLKGSFCPHFDAEPKRKPKFRSMVRSGELAAGYAVDDGVALHFVNGKLENVVSSRPSAGALYFQKRNGRLEESSLSPIRLAAPKPRKTSQRRRVSK
jgi:dipeptidase E